MCLCCFVWCSECCVVNVCCYRFAVGRGVVVLACNYVCIGLLSVVSWSDMVCSYDLVFLGAVAFVGVVSLDVIVCSWCM